MSCGGKECGRVILERLLDEQEYWLRLASLIQYFLDDLYVELLHKLSKVPADPGELYKFLNKHRHRMESLLRRRKITQAQFDLIYPENKKTEIWKLDITTFTFIVRYFTSIRPRGGWRLVNKLERGDKSKGALLIELEHLITENIEDSEQIDHPYFLDVWTDIVYILKCFKVRIQDAVDLKLCSFKDGTVPEKYEHCVLKAQVQYLVDHLRHAKGELLILLAEDDLQENTKDIETLLEQCKQIQTSIDELAEQVHHKTFVKGTELYSKFYNVNHQLEDAENGMKFLKQMITFEKNVANQNKRQAGDGEENDGDEEDKESEEEKENKDDEEDACKKDETDGLVILKSQEEQEEEVQDKNRYRDALRKLKSGYTNTLARDDQGDFDCCLQPYEKLELLVKTRIKNEAELDSSGATYKETTIEELNDLFSHSNHVLIRGVPGAGKSYMVREITSEWIYGHVFPDIKFLFTIDYRDVRHKLYENMEDLVTMLFPSVFEFVTWREITSVPDQVLVVIDNWELFCDYGYIQPEETEFLRCISNVLGPTDGTLTNQRIAITTRPESMDILVDNMQHVNFSIIDVLGFSDFTVDSYVSNFFNFNRKMSKIVKEKLRMNEHMRHLVYLPIHLWSYCCIHQHNSSIGIISTATELYFNKLVILLQESNIDDTQQQQQQQKARRKNKIAAVKENLITNGVLASSMVEAAQCSYQDHSTSRTTSSPLKPIQELLTSVYLYMLNVSPLDVLVDRKFKECLPFLSAMHGSYSSALASPTKMTTTFVRSLDVEHNQDFINQLFLAFIAPYKQTDEYYLGNDFLLFLQAYYEFQGYLVQNNVFKEKEIHIKFHDMNLADVSHLIYFLNHENYQLHIQSIELHAHVPLTERQMESLAVHLVTIPKISIDIKAFGFASEVLYRVFQNYQGTNEFAIKTKEFAVTQAYNYQIQYAVNFDWLIFLDNFHLIIKTCDLCCLIGSLENVIPRGISSSNTINLSHFRLTIQPAHDKLPVTLLTLTKHFMYLRELQLVLTHETKVDDYDICTSTISSRFSGHSTVSSLLTGLTRLTGIGNPNKRFQMHGKVRMLEVPMIKYAIYKAMYQEERVVPNHLQRIVVKDNYCCYEFLMDNHDGKVTLVVDKDDQSYVDVELISF